MQDIRQRRLPSHNALKKLDPDTYNQILDSYGLGKGNNRPLQSMQGASIEPKQGQGLVSKPKTVTQGGYTYTLNPATGGYE